MNEFKSGISRALHYANTKFKEYTQPAKEPIGSDTEGYYVLAALKWPINFLKGYFGKPYYFGELNSDRNP